MYLIPITYLFHGAVCLGKMACNSFSSFLEKSHYNIDNLKYVMYILFFTCSVYYEKYDIVATLSLFESLSDVRRSQKLHRCQI